MISLLAIIQTPIPTLLRVRLHVFDVSQVHSQGNGFLLFVSKVDSIETGDLGGAIWGVVEEKIFQMFGLDPTFSALICDYPGQGMDVNFTLSGDEQDFNHEGTKENLIRVMRQNRNKTKQVDLICNVELKEFLLKISPSSSSSSSSLSSSSSSSSSSASVSGSPSGSGSGSSTGIMAGPALVLSDSDDSDDGSVI